MLDLLTPDGWKAELTLVLVVFRDGLTVRVTHPSRNHLIRTRPLNRKFVTDCYVTKPLQIIRPTGFFSDHLSVRLSVRPVSPVSMSP